MIMRILSLLFLIFFISSFHPAKQDQLFKTNLRLTVIDDLGNVVKGAKVTLYNNKEDYQKEKNPVAGPEYTDEKGRVKFKKLQPRSYYILATYKDKSNAWGGVKTQKLIEGKTNRFNTVIE